MAADTLRVGITCYPSVGGSGVLATALGEDLAARGHDVHFIAYERPFRLPSDAPRLHFHPVAINEYDLFRFPDYTLPLSVRMAAVSREHRLDILHVHYAVPHATAAILARAMLPPDQRPRVVGRGHRRVRVPQARNPARARLRRPDRGHPQLLRAPPARPRARQRPP
jgi:glycosyltransferase involved in cell wall biosynthesis